MFQLNALHQINLSRIAALEQQHYALIESINFYKRRLPANTSERITCFKAACVDLRKEALLQKNQLLADKAKNLKTAFILNKRAM